MRPAAGRFEHLTANGPFATINARLGMAKTDLPGAASLLVIIAAAVIWGQSLQQIDLPRMSDIGLISVLPPSFLLALAMMTVSFVLTLHRRPANLPLVLLHLVVLVIMLFGVTALWVGLEARRDHRVRDAERSGCTGNLPGL